MDLSMLSNSDLVTLLVECGSSLDPTDQEFAKACRDELARRRPVVPAAVPPIRQENEDVERR